MRTQAYQHWNFDDIGRTVEITLQVIVTDLV